MVPLEVISITTFTKKIALMSNFSQFRCFSCVKLVENEAVYRTNINNYSIGVERSWVYSICKPLLPFICYLKIGLKIEHDKDI